ncbi:unnamed protein product [Bursaphelenchus xylophilus]|uniref:(pine wood nematode) hypothetical protein n=1 Tax=Bursaphelenchus xylophilus TaxID=6326 RepID=A0A1I7STZ9_BURXY|nr:unnamed protein product [Bursaphelenchus xylophilus]CAG9107751.1 unnamed protein product [Bursaphelenchus xylophilus]
MHSRRRSPCPISFLLCFHLQSTTLFLVGLLCVSYGSENETDVTVDLVVSSTHGLETLQGRFDDHFNIDEANDHDLAAYKDYLESRLILVSRAQNRSSDAESPKSKRFIPIPISASLPDHGSDYVRSRVAVVAKQNDESENELPEQKTNDEFISESKILKDSTSMPQAVDDENWTYANNSTEIEASTPTQDQRSSVKGNDEKQAKNATEILKQSESQRAHIHHPKAFSSATVHFSHSDGPSFNPTQNHTAEECKRLSQQELVKELKQKGTYNPDLMAWDATGVFRFLDRSILDQYERQVRAQTSNQQAVERNVLALERILSELNLKCQVRSPEVLSKISNLTIFEPRRTVMSPSLRMNNEEITRFKRSSVADDLLKTFNKSRSQDTISDSHQKLVGEVHVVPFGCDKRGEREDGYLRLCGACQAIRKLPDSFFPPFINEVMCDEDKACLYFYDYPHGKCKQKHMNFVVLRNIGTPHCQIWQKFNLNVRVSCECFVDEMSFFSKYV